MCYGTLVLVVHTVYSYRIDRNVNLDDVMYVDVFMRRSACFEINPVVTATVFHSGRMVGNHGRFYLAA